MRTVLVVDDQAPFRAAARAVVSRVDGFDLVAEVESGEAAVEASDSFEPDLVLMDINMPGMTGIEATRRIVAAHPDVVIFLCSTYDAADLPSSAAESGASGYVNKERFGAQTLAQLWQGRGSGTFASL